MKENYININIQRFYSTIIKRTLFLKILFLSFFLLILLRLIQIQIIFSEQLQEIALAQYSRPKILQALRGNIFDCNGNILASSTNALKISIDDSLTTKDTKKSVAKLLSSITNKPTQYYIKKALNAGRYTNLETGILPIYRDVFLHKKFKGVIIEETQKRLYHYGTLAGQILGGVNANNQGRGGIERFFDCDLRGTDGRIINYRDGRKEIKPVVDYPRIEPQNGKNIYLTIDLTYQSIAEEELKKGVNKFLVDTGLVIIMNPKSGEVLAVAQYPEYDPASSDPENLANQSVKFISDAIEPGSLFKIVTAAAALESKKVNPNQVFNAENGNYLCPVGKRGFVRINDTHGYDQLTFREAIEASSNIVMAKISYIVGGDAIYKLARDMGFGVKTGIELSGETAGYLKHPNKWSGTTLQAMSRGYEVQTSPLQLISAYAAIANNGILVKPYLIKKIVNQSSELVFENRPTILRRVLSENTAHQLTNMLIDVVEGKKGTAKLARVEGLKIAGKTGTARKLVNGKYSSNHLLASFVGYFPAENPKIVCLVMLHNPKINGKIAGMGGSTSAVIFKSIAERIRASIDLFESVQELKYASNSDTLRVTTMPDLRNLSADFARNIIEKFNLKISTEGEGAWVVGQIPRPGSQITKDTEVQIIFGNLMKEDNQDLVEVPNVIGLPLKRAIISLMMEGFETSAVGSGLVISQSPSPGVLAKKNTLVNINCMEKKFADNYK